MYYNYLFYILLHSVGETVRGTHHYYRSHEVQMYVRLGLGCPSDEQTLEGKG